MGVTQEIILIQYAFARLAAKVNAKKHSLLCPTGVATENRAD